MRSGYYACLIHAFSWAQKAQTQRAGYPHREKFTAVEVTCKRTCKMTCLVDLLTIIRLHAEKLKKKKS